MAFPCQASKWFLWAGIWELDFCPKHYELVHINQVAGMLKEQNKHFRNGNVPTLWLESKERVSYGLMVPARPTARMWYEAVETWAVDAAGKGGSPAVRAVDRPFFAPPVWWCGRGKNQAVAGKRPYQKLVKLVEAQLKEEARQRGELGSSDEESDGDGEAKGKGKGKAKAKGKATANPIVKKRTSGLATIPRRRTMASVWKATTGASKRKRRSSSPATEPPESSVSRRRSKRVRIVLHGDSEPSDTGEPEQPDSTANPQAASSSTAGDLGAVAPPPRQSRMLTVSEMAGERTSTPERQAAKIRMQKEVESRYSPGPSTQAAAAPPPLLSSPIRPPYTQLDRTSPPPSDRPSSAPPSATADIPQAQEAAPASESTSTLPASVSVPATAHKRAASPQLHGSTGSLDLATGVRGMSIGSDVANIGQSFVALETEPECVSAEDVEMAPPPKGAVPERPASLTSSPPAPAPPEPATPASPSTGPVVSDPLPPPPLGSPTLAPSPALPPTAGAPPPPPPALAHVAARPVTGAPSGHRLVPVSGPDAGGIDALEGRSSRMRPRTKAT
ncbi:hypothetical protein FRC06_009014 [Ceratobasidium sp. 370]|nr:hypothetical protein FRC06_009014 [Ceratobasidium sp. 370]